MAVSTRPPRGGFRIETIANPNIVSDTEGLAGTKTTKRYLGQGVRGSKPQHLEDDDDLRFAIRELEAARGMLAAAHALPAEPRRTKREAIATAIGKVALAGRMIDDVVIRRGGECR